MTATLYANTWVLTKYLFAISIEPHGAEGTDRLHQLLSLRNQCRLRPVGDVQLCEETGHMRTHQGGADKQRLAKNGRVVAESATTAWMGRGNGLGFVAPRPGAVDGCCRSTAPGQQYQRRMRSACRILNFFSTSRVFCGVAVQVSRPRCYIAGPQRGATVAGDKPQHAFRGQVQIGARVGILGQG